MKRLALVAVLTIAALGQTPAPLLPLISAFYSLDNGKTNAYRWMAIDPALSLSVDSTGRPHLLGPTFGQGFITATMPALGPQVSIDTNFIPYRQIAPTASGSCPSTGAWATDQAFFYVCILGPNPNPAALVWARVPLQTDW